ncbi:MAG TPA: response regulator [Polyangiaceae bacterium]|nr:response regulator [Polyangiaceae bacterium]
MAGGAKPELKHRTGPAAVPLLPRVVPADAGAAEEPARPARILCVDDEPAVLTILSRALGNRFEIVTVDDPVAALALLERESDFSVVISDLKMPQMDGEEFLARVKRLAPASSRLALTGSLERELPADQVFGVLTKPCPLRLLHESVTAAVQHHLLLTRPDSVMLEPLPHEIVLMSTAPPDHLDMESGIRERRARVELPSDPDGPPRAVEWPERQSSAFNARALAMEAATDEGIGTLSLLAAVANKFFLLGQVADAERILRPALEDLAARANIGARPSAKDAETAALLAIRLAEETREVAWLDYVLRLFRELGRPLPSVPIERLHVMLRQLNGASVTLFREYLEVLRSSQRLLGAADQFLIRRIEALEPLFRS